jgi:putative ABC transport system permease protein
MMSFSMAFAAIRAHKLRSSLTILGVFVGVTTVIWMVSLVQGLDRSMSRQIAGLGANVLYVTKFDMASNEWGEKPRKDFTVSDADAIARGCPSVSAVCPIQSNQGRIKFRLQETTMIRIDGVGASFLDVRNWGVQEGRFFTESEVEAHTPVCVIGTRVQEALFGVVSPLDKEVLVEGTRYRVIGVLEEKGRFLDQDRDKIVVLPFWSFARQFDTRDVAGFILAMPRDGRLKEQAEDEIREVLRRRRKVPFGEPDDFAIGTQESLLALYKKITGAFFMVMVAISSIGLLVGGIGVMDIMLVSVTERTREIGIRKALGARRADILWQFLIEAMTLTGVGGVLGVGVGLGAAKLVDKFTPLPSAAPLWSVLLAVGIACGVGLVSGMYPAFRASRLEPIEALRYE